MCAYVRTSVSIWRVSCSSHADNVQRTYVRTLRTYVTYARSCSKDDCIHSSAVHSNCVLGRFGGGLWTLPMQKYVRTYARTHRLCQYDVRTYVAYVRAHVRTCARTHVILTLRTSGRTYVSRKYYRNYVRSYVTYVRTGCRFQWILSIFKRSLGFLVATSRF